MAPLIPLACAAFLSASSFFSGSSADEVPEVQNNTDLCLTGINVARSAKLDTRVPIVERNEELEQEATEAISEENIWSNSSSNCTLKDENVTPESLGGLLLKAKDTKMPDANTITGLIQDEIKAGLTALGESSYAASGKFDKETFKKNTSAQNLAYTMFTGSVKVGCAVTEGCQTGNAYIFCKFEPTLEGETVIPFSEDVYKALEARKNAGIDLTTLTDADLNTPLTPETGGSSSAIPAAAIIFLSLVGLLATQ